MKLKAKHDNLIEEIMSDSRYEILESGVILKNKKSVGFTKSYELKLRNKQYRYLKYKGVEIKFHRIIYRKFHGALNSAKIVHHINGDGLDNHASNLQLVSQAENCFFRYYPDLAA